jgi:hypothetical protein
MLEENVTAKPRFHFIADKQNDVSSIVVELDYPVDISDVSRVMENLLLFADKLLRYKGMLWIDGEPNRLLFQGVQRLYSADWDRPWGDEPPHSTLVFIGIQLPEAGHPRRLCRPESLTPHYMNASLPTFASKTFCLIKQIRIGATRQRALSPENS